MTMRYMSHAPEAFLDDDGAAVADHMESETATKSASSGATEMSTDDRQLA